MNKVKKDLNFFKAYKEGSGKAANSSLKQIIIIVSCFVIAIVSTYGALYIIQENMKQQINTITAELSSPEVAEIQKKLSIAAKKYELLSSYKSTLISTKSAFDQSNFVDSELFKTISSCLPTDTVIGTVAFSPQTIQLSCISFDRYSPAIFMHSLEDTGIFSTIKYDGVNYNTENNNYTFNMSCTFGEK